MESLRELFVEELKDVLNAENQLVKALPKLAKTATSPELRKAFEGHLQETKTHVKRLEQVFRELGMAPKGKKCKAMEGLVEEGAEIMEEDMDGALMDAGLISAAQRVEHYEMAAYGCLRAWAETLGETEAVDLLQQTLDEEKAADEKLSKIAETVNSEANEMSGSSDKEDRKAA